MALNGPDYELRWPRALFKSEVADLVNQRSLPDWRERAELLLADAFNGSVPLDEFRKQPDDFGTLDDRHRYLARLLRSADSFPELTDRRPYWSERKSGMAPDAITLPAATREFVRIVNDLEVRGYFEREFEKDCVDDPATVNPSDVLESAIGVPGLWPLSAQYLSENRETLFDVIEVLHDLVSRPRDRSLHSYSGCGWHHSDFAIGPGRELYRWLVNRLLHRAGLEFELSDEGSDLGRLVATTDDGRADLASAMAQREDPSTGDRVRHALALYRRRGATVHDKRSAVVALALVLEERRSLLKAQLPSKDEGALFEIANRFAIRHQNEQQLADYRADFLDWIFWWYLATIELTDRLLTDESRAGL